MADDTQPGTPGASWSIDINVAGVAAASAKFGGPQVTKSGVYRALITDSSRFTSAKGFDTVKFEMRIVGGEFEGLDQDTILPANPDPEKDPTGAKWKARWKALILNCANDPANLEKGPIKFGSASKANPNGKTVYIYVRVPAEGEKDAKGYDKRPQASFMSPSEAQAEMAAEAALAARKAGGGAAGATAQGAQTSAQQPAQQPAQNGQQKVAAVQQSQAAIQQPAANAQPDPLETI